VISLTLKLILHITENVSEYRDVAPLKLSHVFIYSSVFIACLSSHCPLLYDSEIYYHVLVKSLANGKKRNIFCTFHVSCIDRFLIL